jgi:hypothetical protein
MKASRMVAVMTANCSFNCARIGSSWPISPPACWTAGATPEASPTMRTVTLSLAAMSALLDQAESLSARRGGILPPARLGNAGGDFGDRWARAWRRRHFAEGLIRLGLELIEIDPEAGRDGQDREMRRGILDPEFTQFAIILKAELAFDLALGAAFNAGGD